MLIVESGHGRGRESIEDGRLVYTPLWSSGQRQHKAAEGSCKAAAGSFEFQLHRWVPGEDTKSHDTKSHAGTFTSQRQGALQEQITGWATEIYKAGCKKFKESLREIGGSWPNL